MLFWSLKKNCIEQTKRYWTIQYQNGHRRITPSDQKPLETHLADDEPEESLALRALSAFSK